VGRPSTQESHVSFHRCICSCLVVWLVLGAAAARAGSPVEEAVKAFNLLFGSDEPTTPAPAPAPAPRVSDAGSAYRDALRLRRQGRLERTVERLADAGNAGHAGAAYELGMLYTQGKAVEKDLDAAASWINRAADLGDARAQFLVGANLMSAAGGEGDPASGVAFLARAGEQGHARAQNLLGQAYVDGIGVSVNPAWAARWYGRAARAGHAAAQYAYAVMYASGLGLPRSRTEAYRWLVIAQAGGARQAQAVRTRLGATLPTNVTAKLEAEAARFAPQRQDRLDDAATVMFVQFALNGSGYDAGPVDGVMGRRTRAGIKALQRDIGAPAGGAVSSRLLDALIARTAQTG
jgi:localization factor PodJL